MEARKIVSDKTGAITNIKRAWGGLGYGLFLPVCIVLVIHTHNTRPPCLNCDILIINSYNLNSANMLRYRLYLTRHVYML